MFPQDNGPQTGNGFTTSTMNQQNTALLGAPQIQASAMPAFDPSALNSTAFQNNPNVASMVKALKGSA